MTLNDLIQITDRYRLWALRTNAEYMLRRRHGVQQDPLSRRHLLRLALLDRLIAGHELPTGCCATGAFQLPCWLSASCFDNLLSEIRKCLSL